jgi:hypothetical protein
MDWTKEKCTAEEEEEEESAFLVAHSLSRGLLPPCLLLPFNQRKGIASCNYTDTHKKEIKLQQINTCHAVADPCTCKVLKAALQIKVANQE